MSKTIGPYRLNPRGDYNPAADPLYSLLDLVSDGGGSFVYINDTPSNEPTSSTSHWQQIASIGNTGATGATGASAYDMAVLGGYTKTEAEFYTDLATLDNYYPDSWDAVQNAVRAGSIDRYFAPGDQFAVTKGGTSIIYELTDITDATKNTAAGAAAPIPSTYFDSFPNAKPITLVVKYAIPNVQYSAPQANYKVLADIPAGPVNITLASSTVASGASVAYDMSVPAGGFAINSLLRIKDGATNKLLYYATPTSAAVEVSIVAGSTNTPLVVSPNAGDVLSVQNNKDRVAYGSNNYGQSAIRQWVKSPLAKGTFWVPQSIYDLAPLWHSTLDGFLYGVDPEFISVVGITNRITSNNTVTDGGGATPSYTSADKFFMPSRTEMSLGNENSVPENAAWSLFTSDADRIKYLNGGAVTSWWTRTPVAAKTSEVRRITSSGTLHLDNTHAQYAAVVACVIM